MKKQKMMTVEIPENVVEEWTGHKNFAGFTLGGFIERAAAGMLEEFDGKVIRVATDTYHQDLPEGYVLTGPDAGTTVDLRGAREETRS